MSSSSSSSARKRSRTTSGGIRLTKNPRLASCSAPWGPSSTPSTSSSSRSSSAGKDKMRRNSPFPDFGRYMIEKNRKLRNQFDASVQSVAAEVKSISGGGGIFRGVSIFVNGFTVPSAQELRGYMLKHGGRFENYFSRHRVTHIICVNLPDTKLRNLRSFSRGLPVVKPAWIVDSLEAKRLLSWTPYQLNDLTESCKQSKLLSFFHLKGNSSFKKAEGTDESCENSEAGVLLAENKEGAYREADCGFLESKTQEREEAFNATEGSSKIRSDEVAIDEDKQSVVHGCSSTLGQQQHSIVDDSNFVENYFKNSRLHFIGTWRNRYRKRFNGDINATKSERKNVISSPSKETTVIHIDMDCFFVSVIIRNFPELLDKPVAVCHSDNPKGTAEISSANYPARDFGIRAGMFVRDAKALCPQLVIFPYNFEAYEEVADQFYDILHKHCARIQAVSCDEAFLDVTDTNDDPEVVASTIREEIFNTTSCTASAGIAQTLLLARLATRSAKPNNQLFIPREKVKDYLKDLPVNALPGIGCALLEKLKAKHISTCGQLRICSKETLKNEFGMKTGDMLWNYSRGIDNRVVEMVQETKSIGAEVNWGIRFDNMTDCEYFLMNLCKEVSLRLLGCSMQGRTITLKVKKRKAGAEEPVKYMGCGECINLSRSMTVAIATDNVNILQRISKQLFGSLHVDVKEVRGIGLQISRLEHVVLKRQGHEGNRLESWLASASDDTRNSHEDLCLAREDNNGAIFSDRVVLDGESSAKCTNFGSWKLGDTSEKCYAYDMNPTSSSFSNLLGPESHSSGPQNCPPISHLDMDIIKNLPSDIFKELNETYGGRLSSLLKNHSERKKVHDNEKITSSMEIDKLISVCSKKERFESGVGINNRQTLSQCSIEKGKGKRVWPLPSLVHGTLSENKGKDDGTTDSHAIRSPDNCRADLMPGSLSQVDMSVLQQLPEELKADVFELLPAHRKLDDADLVILPVKNANCDNRIEDSNFYNMNLWEGDPPLWVHKFQVSSSSTLNTFADLYSTCGRSKCLSSILQRLMSIPIISLANDEWDNAFSGVCELLTQYAKVKIDSDIEEIYVCCRLLRRCASRSNFFLYVYDKVVPSLQALVSEVYGGKLQLS